MPTSGYHAASLSAVSFCDANDDLDARPLASGAGVEMLGTSAAMERLRLQVRRIGPHFRMVMLRGEAGSGKKTAARALHRMSSGAGGPFVVCQASTLSSAFEGDAGDGSGEARSGNGGLELSGGSIVNLMKMAHRGTLFLDEMGHMPLQAQGQLLRVLRRQEWALDGLTAAQKMDLRIIASTSQDLRGLAAAGHFQQELYQKIATLEIALPPLRDRVEDIPELAIRFLHRLARVYGKNVECIADEAMQRLTLYSWPGNVRELENTLRLGVLMSEGAVLQPEDLPVFSKGEVSPWTSASADGTTRLQDVVERHVLLVLKNCGGNKLRAAEMLGISRSTLYRMLEACASAAVLR